MSSQGTSWADSIIIQAVADVFNLKIILIIEYDKILLRCILCGRSDCCSCRGTMFYFYWPYILAISLCVNRTFNQ